MPDLYTLTAVWRKPTGELHTRATVEAYARFVHSHIALEFGCTLESLTLEPAGE